MANERERVWLEHGARAPAERTFHPERSCSCFGYIHASCWPPLHLPHIHSCASPALATLPPWSPRAAAAGPASGGGTGRARRACAASCVFESVRAAPPTRAPPCTRRARRDARGLELQQRLRRVQVGLVAVAEAAVPAVAPRVDGAVRRGGDAVRGAARRVDDLLVAERGDARRRRHRLVRQLHRAVGEVVLAVGAVAEVTPMHAERPEAAVGVAHEVEAAAQHTAWRVESVMRVVAGLGGQKVVVVVVVAAAVVAVARHRRRRQPGHAQRLRLVLGAALGVAADARQLRRAARPDAGVAREPERVRLPASPRRRRRRRRP